LAAGMQRMTSLTEFFTAQAVLDGLITVAGKL